jgi:hypothetical protein
MLCVASDSSLAALYTPRCSKNVASQNLNIYFLVMPAEDGGAVTWLAAKVIRWRKWLARAERSVQVTEAKTRMSQTPSQLRVPESLCDAHVGVAKKGGQGEVEQLSFGSTEKL